MKKFIYLCGMMLLSLNMMAQIDWNDRNWDWNNAFRDDFVSYRSWDTNSWISIPDNRWRAFLNKVTHGHEKQVYQFNHCIFDTISGEMRLFAEYDTTGLIENQSYPLPDTMHGIYSNYDSLFYFSGEMIAMTRFRYGYFEIRCKLPVHQGAFPAFWLYSSYSGSNNSYYEEIDVFEYSWWITSLSGPNPDPPGTGSKRCFTCGIYFNDEENNPDEHSYGRAYPLLPPSSSDLDEFHTYSCEWMPDHVIWYFDGTVLNEYFNMDSIPHRSLELIANYAIDKYCFHNDSTWVGPDEMLIDYINVFQLKWECDSIETITSQNDLDNFEYAVKKSISINSIVDEPVVKYNNKITFRVTDLFEVTGPFEVVEVAEFTVIMQSCPPPL